MTKLLLQTDADFTFFGEKDYQQLQVVRRVTQDLDLKTEIIPCPTVREDDGLAMSSRNLRLSPDARAKAPAIARALKAATTAIESGASASDALMQARSTLENSGFDEIDYLEARSDPDLIPIETASQKPGRVFVAVWLDGVRLIDNEPFNARESAST